jgi:uncharacterized membrane protein
MNPECDPIWPWSLLRNYLLNAGPAAALAVVAAGLAAFALPVLAYLRPWGLGWRQLLRGTAVLLLVVSAALLFNGWGTTGGVSLRAEGMGLSLLVVVPLLLAGLTVWAYLGVAGASRRRVGVILALRLIAFLLVILAVARPSLGFPDPNQVRAVLYIAADASRSMTIQDEAASQSRWNLFVQKLKDSEGVLRRLREEQQIDIVFYRWADGVDQFQPDAPGEADGKRTETGQSLRSLFERREGSRPHLGLLLVSDGADNGVVPALAEAGRWRNLPCPLHAFACGNPNNGDRQSDVAITAITTEPAPVPVKGKLTVKLLVDAPGFENSTLRARLFLDDKEMLAKDVGLPLTAGNEVKLECNAPTTPGEVKLKVALENPQRAGQPPPGDLVPSNNVIETFVTVSKEGISVLLVDKQRAGEPQAIYDALARDARIHQHPVWIRGERPLDPNAGDLFQFDRQQYDVIIIGDVTARQLQAVSPGALAAIEKLVEGGAGFLMMGGYSTFGNGDWDVPPINRLLPVDLSVRGQDEDEVHMVPTDAGLRRFSYLLRLDDTKDARAAWSKLPKLQGMTRLGPARELGTVLAESDGPSHAPMLVTANYGKGRTLAFAGDTTHRWIRSPELKQMHSRFWRQLVIWLARQEDAEGSVWVKPDVRRLPARAELGFSVGVRSKGGVDLADGKYKVRVVGPGGAAVEVPTANGPTDTRGNFTRTEVPGEYRIEVQGEAKDPSTGEDVRGEAAARFIVYTEDLEMTRRAADHEFLRKLSAAGGGDFHRVEDLPRFLEKLQHDPLARAKPKMRRWPDWSDVQRDPRAPSPFRIAFFVLFVAVVSGEWLLRRRWGLV